MNQPVDFAIMGAGGDGVMLWIGITSTWLCGFIV